MGGDCKMGGFPLEKMTWVAILQIPLRVRGPQLLSAEKAQLAGLVMTNLLGAVFYFRRKNWWGGLCACLDLDTWYLLGTQAREQGLAAFCVRKVPEEVSLLRV